MLRGGRGIRAASVAGYVWTQHELVQMDTWLSVRKDTPFEVQHKMAAATFYDRILVGGAGANLGILVPEDSQLAAFEQERYPAFGTARTVHCAGKSET